MPKAKGVYRIEAGSSVPVSVGSGFSTPASLAKSRLARYAPGMAIPVNKTIVGKEYPPYTVTVDHDTLEGKGVTVRERDSQRQIRVEETELASSLSRLLSGDEAFPAG